MQRNFIKSGLLAALVVAVGMLATSAQAATKTFSNIDQMSGWDHCTVCAGAGGQGSVAVFSMQQNVSSPSMDGRSAKFFLGGTNNYSNALWWKQLGSHPTTRNFVYDLYFYIKNPGAAQALEFDVNQSLNGKKYIFGTQCALKRHAWDVYDPFNRRWVQTNVYCSTPTAYKWHHVVLEFRRSTTNKVSFISVTINGKKAYFNRGYWPRSSSAKELNVAFQMDGDKYQTDYTVWLDKVKLTAW
jgi:hypothetical protein